MTTQEYDTDPSTPGAKRLSDPRTGVVEGLQDVSQDPEGSPPDEAPAVPHRRLRPTTDPGIAPPAQPLPLREEPMGIVVPSALRAPNDSVDALLEGIHRERSENVGTPQTDGQTAASYHGEHALRAAQVAARAEPKVLIERPVLAQTLRIRVKPSGAVLRDSEVKPSTDITAVNSPPMMGRLAIAVAAGVVVVIMIFAMLQRISTLSTISTQAGSVHSVEPVGAAAVTPATSTLPTPPAPSSVLAVDPGATAKASADTDAPAPLAVASSTTRKATPPAKPKPRAKPASSVAKPAAEDLGEFKATF